MADTDQVDIVPDESIADINLATTDTDIAPKTDAPSETAEEQNAADTEDKPAESDESSSEGEQAPAEEQAPVTEDAEAIKQRNAAMAQKRIQERQRTKQNVTQQLDQTYGPKTADEFVQEGLTPEQAEIKAMREEMQFERRKTEIAEMNAGLQVEAVNVYNDFPVFNPESKDFDKDFAQEVEQAYATAARLQTDENGIILNAEVPLYDFYQRMANIYNRGQSKGTQQARTDTLQMLAQTENVGGSSSTSGNTSNDLADLEERLGDVVIT